MIINHYYKLNKNKSNYANRGLNLENDINLANEYYKINDVAYIYKKPTPIKLVKVDYKLAKITEGYFDTPSTTDYNGLYKGHYIDFEAKETNNLTSFPLANIHKHQIKHIRNISTNGGICFLIVRFTKLNKNFLLTAEDFINFIDNFDRKSIPLSYFEANAYILEYGYMPRLDYIKVIDHLLEVSK